MVIENYPVSRDDFFVIVDSNGEVTGSIPLGRNITELIVPTGHDQPLIVKEGENSVIVPEKDLVLPYGEIIVDRGFELGLDTSIISPILGSQLERERERDIEEEARERAEKEAMRLHERKELQRSPKSFLEQNVEKRLSHVDIKKVPEETGLEPREFAFVTYLDVVEDPHVQSIKGGINLYAYLADRLRTYRINAAKQSGAYEIEMPMFNALAERLVGSLDTANSEERRAIYDTLGQLEIPLKKQEQILLIMEDLNKNDYPCNPLAAEYALNQYNFNPSGNWVTVQAERQAKLRELVGLPREEAMDKFEEAMKLAHRIVFCTPPDQLPKGRIGMEFEDGLVTGESKFSQISKEWDVGKDCGFYTEVRKSDEKLSFGCYPRALVELDSWKADNFTSNSNNRFAPSSHQTFHLHLGKLLHPKEPLYGLYSRGMKNNSLHTWELRGVLPFRSAAESLAFTELAIHSASLSSEEPVVDRMSTESISSWQKMLYGHIVHQTDNPDARKAALVALRDPFAMRYFNLRALNRSYEKKVFEIIHQDPDKFLAAGSPSHYREFYSVAQISDTPRDPQRLYDDLDYPLMSSGDRALTVGLLLVDPLAYEQIIKLLTVCPDDMKNVNIRELRGQIIDSLHDINIDLARKLLPITLDDNSGLDYFVRKTLICRIMAHEEIAEHFFKLLLDKSLSEDLKPTVLSQMSGRYEPFDRMFDAAKKSA